jgi:tRNA(fMet)-specific endonuclease VapC
MGLMLDSTLCIRAEREKRSPEDMIAEVVERFGDQALSLSVMTAGEMFHGVWRADSAQRRARREEFVEALLAAIPSVPITLPIMRIFAEIDARLRSNGHALPTSDLLIGSSALARGDAVVTGNPRHFRRIPGLEVHVLP